MLLGRNNSGKTNFLRLIAGLASAARGDVTLDGESLNAVPTGARPVGFVFQAFVNYPHWTVRQNIESPLRARKLKRTERDNRVARIAETLQLEDLLARKPGELSGGQQQRLAIGRALASDARVLLLDEPFVNLDFRLRERLTQQLGELLRSTGTTVVFASSDCRDAFALGDTVVLLADQQVLQSGQPLSVYRDPVSLAAADLMSEPAANWHSNGSGLEVIRPEHMLLAGSDLAGFPGDPLRYSLKVEAIETNGSHTFVQGALVQGGLSSPSAASVAPRWVARLNGMLDLQQHIAADQTLTLFVDPRNRLELPAPEEATHGRA